MDQLARQWIDGVVLGSQVAKHLGVIAAELEVDSVRIRLPFDSRHTTILDVTHGGVIATLVDIAGAAASASGLTASDHATGGATSHLSVSYLAPAVGSDLEAQATVIHRSRSATHSDVLVRDSNGSLVAKGEVTSRIFH